MDFHALILFAKNSKIASPDWCASEVDVKIGPALFYAHQAILLNFGVHHVVDRIGGLNLKIFQMPGPNFVNPVDLSNYSWSNNLQFEMT